jgi:hypothetical protein
MQIFEFLIIARAHDVRSSSMLMVKAELKRILKLPNYIRRYHAINSSPCCLSCAQEVLLRGQWPQAIARAAMSYVLYPP